MPEPIRAAGGVVFRLSAEGAPEVVLVHRPSYADWTFPKGKADPGESDEQCAVREVAEETGLVCELGEELLPPVEYRDRFGRPKVVRYWAMTPAPGQDTWPDAAVHTDNEVDEVGWFGLTAAAERLSYPRDLGVLETFRSGHTRLAPPAKLQP